MCIRDSPDGVLLLTCGVDTQDDRLEYEVVGHRQLGERWGIRKGIIMGRPDSDDTWSQLDDIIGHVYRFEKMCIRDRAKAPARVLYHKFTRRSRV